MMKERKERRASSCADVGVGGGFGIGLWCCSDYPPAYKVAQEANRHKQRCHLLLCKYYPDLEGCAHTGSASSKVLDKGGTFYIRREPPWTGSTRRT